MARIDLNLNQPDEQQLRKSIKQEIKKEVWHSEISGKLKHLGRRLGCLFLICLIIFGLVSVVLAIAAKTST